jgi:hypothetical protein
VVRCTMSQLSMVPFSRLGLAATEHPVREVRALAQPLAVGDTPELAELSGALATLGWRTRTDVDRRRVLDGHRLPPLRRRA